MIKLKLYLFYSPNEDKNNNLKKSVNIILPSFERLIAAKGCGSDCFSFTPLSVAWLCVIVPFSYVTPVDVEAVTAGPVTVPRSVIMTAIKDCPGAEFHLHS